MGRLKKMGNVDKLEIMNCRIKNIIEETTEVVDQEGLAVQI